MHVPAVAVGLRCAVTEIMNLKPINMKALECSGAFILFFLPKSDNKMIAR